MSQFHGDAIVLSGTTGTKLKCQILSRYYPLWWGITSGGKEKGFGNHTAIIEMNAGSGEDYIEETNETILGSSGHALALKAGEIIVLNEEKPDTTNLRIVLVEEDKNCFLHLMNVIKRRWPTLLQGNNRKNEVHLVNANLENAVKNIGQMDEDLNLGNSLFFFDPLLYTPWSQIDHVAETRIKWYYETGTEFIVFLFTSDWFRGRSDLVPAPLPKTKDSRRWSDEEIQTVEKVNDLFGYEEWQLYLLNSKPYEERLATMVELYRKRLHKWFRYVLPLPFAPKSDQIYHLFMCSNYEQGVRITRQFYTQYTLNPSYSPDNPLAYSKFLSIHPDKKMKGNRRSEEWKMLWSTITKHDEGICDVYCSDLKEIQRDNELRAQSLEWLESNKYLIVSEDLTDAWSNAPTVYRINWQIVKEKLGIDPPPILTPLSPTN